jgi:type I restriction enzyme S subunit
MDVKPGYKQTEVGVIPENWELVAIGSVGSFTSGQGISVAALSEQSSDTPVPVYGGNGIAGYTAVSLVDEPVVVVGRVGQKCGEVYLTQGPAWITDNALFPRTMHRKIDVRFLASVMKAAGLNNVKNRNDLPLVTQSILHSVRIPLPPTLAEQQAIAEALSDVDALISALDRLITKKRAIKQGAMQELLTGRRRLPGFDGEWEVRHLGSILQLRYGKSQRGITISGGDYPVLATSGEFGRTNRILYDRPSVIIGRKGTIDAPLYVDTPFWAIDTTYYSEISELAHPKYLYYLFTTFDWYAYNEASGVPSLNAKTVHSIEASLPPILEQTAIATALSDMDAEIAALERRRDKTKLLKQGMMQELLTGKTRLI